MIESFDAAVIYAEAFSKLLPLLWRYSQRQLVLEIAGFTSCIIRDCNVYCNCININGIYLKEICLLP